MTQAQAAFDPNAAEDVDFTLFVGGPLYQLLTRIGLIDGGLHRLTARIAWIVALTWLPLVALTGAEGTLLIRPRAVSFLGDVECHARFLLAVPLLLIAERVVHERMRPIVAQFRTRELVGPEDLDRLDGAIRGAYRLRNSALIEAALLAVVYVTSFVSAQYRYTSMFTASWYNRPGEHALSMAGMWFVFVSLPLFQFLLCRWYFRLAIWAGFLWRAAGLPLRLNALHPDKAGGLGFLGQSLSAFVPLAAAHGVIMAGYLADRIFYSGDKLTDYKLVILAAVLALLGVFAGPLCLFVPLLARTRRAGLREYGRVAQVYVRTFEQKWISGPPPDEEPLVGSGDIQSLADLANSYGVAESMRLTPISRTAVLQFVAATVAPIVPLLLTVMPAEKLASTLVRLVL